MRQTCPLSFALLLTAIPCLAQQAPEKNRTEAFSRVSQGT